MALDNVLCPECCGRCAEEHLICPHCGVRLMPLAGLQASAQTADEDRLAENGLGDKPRRRFWLRPTRFLIFSLLLVAVALGAVAWSF